MDILIDWIQSSVSIIVIIYFEDVIFFHAKLDC